jgi:hypothetical protein
MAVPAQGIQRTAIFLCLGGMGSLFKRFRRYGKRTVAELPFLAVLEKLIHYVLTY